MRPDVVYNIIILPDIYLGFIKHKLCSLVSRLLSSAHSLLESVMICRSTVSKCSHKRKRPLSCPKLRKSALKEKDNYNGELTVNGLITRVKRQ